MAQTSVTSGQASDSTQPILPPQQESVLAASRKLLQHEAAQPQAELWRRYRIEGDSRLRAELVSVYESYARSIAARLYRARGKLAAQFSDYFQSALVGLLEAIDRYDPNQGVTFRRFAGARIRGAVLNALPDMSELHAQSERRRCLERERLASLAPDSSRATAEQRLLAVVELTRSLAIGFLLDDSGMFSQSEHRQDQRAYDECTRRELAAIFAVLMARLPPRQERVLRYHYFCGLQFNAVAAMMGMSAARVSQLHRDGLRRLRQLYEAQGRIDWSG